jgi:hypothetical protein
MGESTKPERRVTAGGRDLRKYLDEIGQSVPDFCEKHRLDRIQVQRVMNGERYRNITVNFAHSIERATGGRVKWSRFLSETAAAPTKRAA